MEEIMYSKDKTVLFLRQRHPWASLLFIPVFLTCPHSLRGLPDIDRQIAAFLMLETSLIFQDHNIGRWGDDFII